MKRLFFVAILVWAIITYAAVSGGRTGTSVQPGSFPPVHPNAFFELGNFYTEGFSDSSSFIGIKGGVIPHHLVADKLIARVFKQLKNQKPKTIVLIGPNHHNAGEPMITSSLGWQTPFGVVEVEQKLLESVMKSEKIKKNDEVISKEHAMGNIMPFIKYYLPETKVVPIILHHGITMEEAYDLGEKLVDLMGEDTIILASVDFSHYLKSEEAEKKDQETIFALKNWNLGRVFAMNDDYLDSPASIGVLFKAMDKLEMHDFTILNHTNSGVLLGNKNIETTSYITLLFGIENK